MLIHNNLRNTKLVTKDGVLSIDGKGIIKGLAKSKEQDYKDVLDITYKEDPKVEHKEPSKEKQEPAKKTTRIGRPRKKSTAKKE